MTDKVFLIVEHIPSGQCVALKEIKLSSFNDRINTNWSEDANVFGRMDPIVTYQGATRNISMAFDLGADTPPKMARALAVVTRLMQFQYPGYAIASNALTLERPPLLNIQFANYIRSGANGPLLCAMKGMAYKPSDNFQAASMPRIDKSIGFPASGPGEGGKEPHIIPLRVSVNLELTVLHDEPPAYIPSPWFEAGPELDFAGGEHWGKIDFDRDYGLGSAAGGAASGVSAPDIQDLPDAEQAAAIEGIQDLGGISW
jgi:hypothetical protein